MRALPIAIPCLAGLALLLAACEETTIGPYADRPAESADLVDRDIPPLNAAEVRVFLRGSTLVHEGDDRVWHVYLEESGRLSGQSRVKETDGVERAIGTWEVRPDGMICRQWTGDWAGGDHGCAKVFRYGQDYVFVGEDGTEARRTRVPGNPLSL